MAILRRANQRLLQRFPGGNRYYLAGSKTGSRMLHVGEILWSPGSSMPSHIHPEPKAEESQLMLDGELELTYEGQTYTMRPGDVALAPPGASHAWVNKSGKMARMVTVFPMNDPSTKDVEPPPAKTGPQPRGIVFKKEMKLFEFQPGIMRYDLVTEAQGAKSTFFSMLFFEPGSKAPTHYHPTTEEAQFIVSGELIAVYGNEVTVCRTGDLYLAEPGLRHGFTNKSDRQAVLLAIHPTAKPERVLVDDTDLPY
ncbi:MAG: cupin domain-containing protein [Chloroflexi bacterium]|nr:cupin domain-containing protein [Chloroflexota bacterium]